MRVKRLEIQGFKSFKDKTVIHFDHSITGIVGPNGCGKSNIVDAFFWVMGEQSYKHIRGTGSGDLIFNGSAKYPSLGLAEVTLVLETDYVDTENAPAGATVKDVPVHLRSKEVAVTRRVYRGGEGEYFLNGVPCRLKDIHELFLDTGVGTKGYSVIEQGQIGKIINSKPDDRRVLVEEAAGIAKYKARKRESIRKMEHAKSNLDRLNDVIREIESKMASLERQAQRARRYNEYKQELFEKETTWGRRKLQVLKQKIQELTEKTKSFEEEKLSSETEIQTLETQIQTNQTKELSDTKTAETLQEELQRLTSDLTHEQSALELSKKRQEDLLEQIESMQTESVELLGQIEEEKKTLAEREAESETLERQSKEDAEKARELDETVGAIRSETGEIRERLDGVKKELIDHTNESSELVSRGAELRARLESSEGRVEQLRSERMDAENRILEIKGEKDRSQSDFETAKENRERVAQEISDENQELSRIESELKEKQGEQEKAVHELAGHVSRIESLEELNRAHEGMDLGPKSILDWTRESGQGTVMAVVADSFKVEKNLEAALEGWLETRLDHLFCNDVEFALKSFEHIRAQNHGRAAIHLPGSLTERQTRRSLEDLKRDLEGASFNVRGALSEFVEVEQAEDGAVLTIAQGMLEKVLLLSGKIETNLEKFLSDYGLDALGGWSLVDEEGTVLESDGTLRGGSTQCDTMASVLGRKRAIEELSQKVKDAQIAKKLLEQKIENLERSLSESRSKLENLQKSQQEAEVKFASVEKDLAQHEKDLREKEEEFEKSAEELKSLETERDRARKEQDEIKARLDDISSRKLMLEESARDGDQNLSEKEIKLRSEEETLGELKVREASSRERHESLKREVETNRNWIAEREKRKGELERLLERVQDERQRHTGDDSRILEKIEELTRAKSESDEKFRNLKNDIERVRLGTKEDQDRLRTLQRRIQEIIDESSSSAIEKEKLSSEQSFHIQNLEDKYGPGCLETVQEEMSEAVVTDEMSEEEEQALNEEVERLKTKMRRLGEVNPMAVEEYEKEKTRFDGLTTQRSDLEQSIQNLEDAIEHINQTSEDRFRKAFEAIAERFEQLFPIIFGGGRAELSLIYPEDSNNILDAGIDILAQPPGKKIANISLLSGGEKALSALSLVFSIFMVKPSPFCVLDEVDAPLDDANIGKFNALLKEMAMKTQFILITHNKKTMELNDTLYGVTMEEPGVSKMVSIELD